MEQGPYCRPIAPAEAEARPGNPLSGELSGRLRDIAPFNIAIDSKLRGGHVAPMKVVDVMASGQSKGRASVL